MKQKSILLFITLVVSLLTLSCKKQDASSSSSEINNKEEVLYKNETAKSIWHGGSIFGGNTKKVVKIDYNNSVLESLRKSSDWNIILSKNNISKDEIIKTTVINTGIELISIPTSEKENGADCSFNIYVKGDKFIITKAYSLHLPNGNTRISIISYPENNLYYEVDLDSKNRLGNWKFGTNEIPFHEKFATETSNIINKVGLDVTSGEEEIGGRCSEKPYFECMQCLIKEVCASSWVCILECTIAPIPCVGTMSLMCVTGL